jgi:hypothetical protein
MRPKPHQFILLAGAEKTLLVSAFNDEAPLIVIVSETDSSRPIDIEPGEKAAIVIRRRQFFPAGEILIRENSLATCIG